MIVEKGKETEETEQKEGRARDEGVCVCVCGGGGDFTPVSMFVRLPLSAAAILYFQHSYNGRKTGKTVERQTHFPVSSINPVIKYIS